MNLNFTPTNIKPLISWLFLLMLIRDTSQDNVLPPPPAVVLANEQPIRNERNDGRYCPSTCNIYPQRWCYNDRDCQSQIPNSECVWSNSGGAQEKYCRCFCDHSWNGRECVQNYRPDYPPRPPIPRPPIPPYPPGPAPGPSNDERCWFGFGILCDPSAVQAVVIFIVVALLIIILFAVFICVVVTCCNNARR